MNTFNALFNLALYFADIYTDVILLIDFIKYGWIYCVVGLSVFLALSYLVAMGGIFVTRKILPRLKRGTVLTGTLVMILRKLCFICSSSLSLSI